MRNSALAVSFAVFGLTAQAQAALYTTNFGSLVPGYVVTDTGDFGPVALPFSLNLYGENINSVKVGNQGYVVSPTHTRAIAPYLADLFSQGDPLGPIAPGTGGSGVYFNQTSANQMIFTWDRLGYCCADYVNRAQFQLVLNNPGAPTPEGEADIGFFYGQLTSPDGFAVVGFQPSASGFDLIPIFAPATAVAAIQSGPGRYWFDLQDGVPVAVEATTPEPASLAVLAIGLIGLASMRRQSPPGSLRRD
jgi:hypothetical protein